MIRKRVWWRPVELVHIGSVFMRRSHSPISSSTVRQFNIAVVRLLCKRVTHSNFSNNSYQLQQLQERATAMNSHEIMSNNNYNVNGVAPTKTPITTIFFDLDNTLIPTRKADTKACNRVSSQNKSLVNLVT